MTELLQVIIDRAMSGELELGEACAELEELVSLQTDGGDELARALEMQIESGRLSGHVGDALLDVVRRGPRTRARMAAATLVQPPASAVAADTRQRAEREQSHTLLGGGLATGAVLKERFVLEAMIGRGGMGIVFSAQDRRKQEALDPNPRVAIKILNADFRGEPQALMALQREAQKAQSLAHPNVATVFDFDRDGATVFMTMELLHGRSVETVIRDAHGRGVGRDAALPIIRGIAEGLAYAHRKGIVHSDLKPANVFLLEDGTPKILDFGIARAVPSTAAAQGPRDVFDAGSLGAYTAAYATQEMIDGADPHPAHDLYALGLIAYELLTGRHPFERHGVAKARELGLKAEPIKGLKRREWRALERCLAFDEAVRPRDAAEFIRLFFGVTRLQKSLLAAVFALVLVSGYLWYQHYIETGPVVPFRDLPQATQQELRNTLMDADREWDFYQKDGNTFALWSAVDQYADAYRLHPRNRKAVKGLEKAADALLDRARTDPQMRGEVAKALAEKNEYLAKYEPVVDALAAR
jgi:serine/threonine protein kinase